jgi:hypothetical protein
MDKVNEVNEGSEEEKERGIRVLDLLFPLPIVC